MRDITRRHLRVLNSDGWLPIILMDIRLPGTSAASTIYLTNAGEAVTWNSNTYMSVNMARGLLEDIVATDSNNTPSLTMQISNIDRQMARLLNTVTLEDSEAVVRVCDRRLLDRPRDQLALTTGRIRQPQISKSSLTFQVVNIIGQMDEILIPRRLWKADCSYTFGSAACGAVLTDSPNQIDSVVLAGSSTQYVVVSSSVLSTAGSPAVPNDYWMDGYIVFKDGPNAAAARQFQRYQLVGSQHRFYVKTEWRNTPEIGNTVFVRRGCPKTKPACIDRRGSINPYGGFEEVPYGSIDPSIIGGIDDIDAIWQ